MREQVAASHKVFLMHDREGGEVAEMNVVEGGTGESKWELTHG